MVKEICKDLFFLGQKAEPATRADVTIGRDLQDTLAAHTEHCVGMAANMIGVNKSIIIVDMGMLKMVMYNPVIVSQSEPYEAEEGCLSLEGTRKTTRFQDIEVEYFDAKWKKHRQKMTGFAAQIVQHEVDHLNGIII